MFSSCTGFLGYLLLPLSLKGFPLHYGSSTILAPLFSLASLALEILLLVRMGQIDYHGSSCLRFEVLSVSGYHARTRLPISWVIG